MNGESKKGAYSDCKEGAMRFESFNEVAKGEYFFKYWVDQGDENDNRDTQMALDGNSLKG
jgi:hypothetical protein